MFEIPLMKRLGLTPAKLALVGVLAVVLLVVIVIQWPKNTPKSPATAVKEVNANNGESSALEPHAEAAVPQPTRSEVVWPELSLEEVVRHDPFQLPAHLRPMPETENKQKDPRDPQILQTLAQAEGGMILMVGNERVARIGAATLRPGDKIGSYRVSKIDATGVWLVEEEGEPK